MFGRADIIAGMDSGMYGLRGTMAGLRVRELCGFRVTMTGGMAVIAITVDTGARFIELF